MATHEDDQRRSAALRCARASFLDSGNHFGCAESTLIALAEAFGLPDAGDSSPAMALNGGFGYSGGTCGALTGAGLAVGRLAERRFRDHHVAKAATRSTVQGLMDDFTGEFGSVICRDLIGVDLRAPDAHEAFIASGVWRDGCLRQIEFVVRRLANLGAEPSWQRGVAVAGPEPAQ